MRVLFLSLSILISVISFAQTESLVVIKPDTSRILKSYMHKDYCPNYYLHRFYHQNIGNTKITIPYKVIIPINWKFRSKKYYKTHNNIKRF